MQSLVLATYLALVIAVAGQAVHVQKEAPAEPEKLQVHDVPIRGDGPQVSARDRKERIHETASDRAGSARGEANLLNHL